MRAVKFGLMAPERLKDSAREGFGRTAIAYVVLLVALVLTVLAFYYVGRNVEAREHERFEEITGSAERAVDRRMQTYIDAMLDGRGLFAASESVTREEWAAYVAGSDLKRRATRGGGVRETGEQGPRQAWRDSRRSSSDPILSNRPILHQTGAMYFAPCQHAQASQALCKRHQAKPIT